MFLRMTIFIVAMLFKNQSNMLTKDKKKEIVAELNEALDGAKSLVFVNFKGLPVSMVTELRRSLTKENVSYRVAKKTLMKIALDKRFDGELPALEGETAMIYGVDALAPSRIVYNFEKTHKENIKVLGGVFEGKYLGRDGILAIAMIPPIEVLYGQLVGILSSPYRSLVVTLDQIAKKK